MKIIVTFALLSLVNVVASTIRTLLTVKGGKWVASISSAAYFAFYNIILIYTVADFSLWVKCLITFICNLLGVFVVKVIEERRRPVKMWKVEMALPAQSVTCPAIYDPGLDAQKIPHRFTLVGNWWIFECYCDTPAQTAFVHDICKLENGKISAYESKDL